MEKKVMMKMNMEAVLLLFLVSNTIKSVHGVTCTEAISTLDPCLPFLIGTEPAPTEPCCLGVERLSNEAYTKEIRREICECFKKYGPPLCVEPEKAKQLPGLCHVENPVPIDPSMDCSTVTKN
ncbi:Nonspecific lipid-transfer protein precursor, putative [Ricinus communis]|uniref:Non-specific lipid-transfer protein n=1 Tax=Ricinus communis TaxID=3988 RepID=B9S3I5_RICCO|nr:Nonspecific lipid-transfer protein precursor, putative [Ricinus communis]|eukprot:XP_002520554.1 non-specific lipid-transfer protein AP10 [Ricinus communis]